MGAKTEIAWTDATWNPLRGCARVSEGCRNCYAETVAARFSGPGQPYEGLATRSPGRWTGEVRLVEKHLTDPLRWKEPRRIFVNSMSDLFHERVPDEWIDRIFAVMALSPRHTFQILTKRPERVGRYFDAHEPRPPGSYLWAHERIARLIAQPDWVELPRGRAFIPRPLAWPLPNVWLGVSVEDQKTANERIPELLSTPAALHFVSYEPALGLVDFTAIRSHPEGCQPGPWGNTHHSALFDHAGFTKRLQWVIVGGESGPHARPFDVAWARATIKACRAAGVACFVKQLGARSYRQPVYSDGAIAGGVVLHIRDRKGADPAEWPEDLRVQEFPKEAP